MNVQAEKLELIEWLISIVDEDVISKIKALKKSSTEESWHESVSEEEKVLIMKGLDDIERGDILSHEEVMNHLNEKYGKLV